MSATSCGNPTVPGEGTPNPSLEAGCVTTPVAARPSGNTTRMVAPIGTPRGISMGIDHHPSGSGSVRDSTDLVMGSPALMSAVAEAPRRYGSGIAPSGTCRHSMRSSVMAVPAEIAVLANGNGSLRRSEISQASAARTIAPAANHRRYGGRESHNTVPPYRLLHLIGRGSPTEQDPGWWLLHLRAWNSSSPS